MWVRWAPAQGSLRDVPKRVDHTERRKELAAAAAAVLVRDGLAAMTTRKITEEAGESKGILGHYFINKAELMVAVLEVFHERVESRMMAIGSSVSGLDRIRAIVAEALPLDAVRCEEAVAEVSFAAAAVADTEIRDWYGRQRHRLRSELRNQLEVAQELGDIRQDLDPAGSADLLLALVDSVSLQTVVGGPGVSPAEQLLRLDALLGDFAPRKES